MTATFTPTAERLLRDVYAHGAAQAYDGKFIGVEEARQYGREDARRMAKHMREQVTGQGPVVGWIREDVMAEFEPCLVEEAKPSSAARETYTQGELL